MRNATQCLHAEMEQLERDERVERVARLLLEACCSEGPTGTGSEDGLRDGLRSSALAHVARVGDTDQSAFRPARALTRTQHAEPGSMPQRRGELPTLQR